MNIHTAFADARAINPRAVIGDNLPPPNPDAPTLIDRARAFYLILSGFLKETPVVQSHDEARRAANYIEQSRATLGELEDARKARVNPLNEEVKAINDEYRAPRESLQALMDEVKRRATAFAQAEEDRRAAAAIDAARVAAQAAQAAHAAEAIEANAKASADVGECGVNIAAVITQADRAFAAFKRADRTAARAAREVPVRLAGGMGRAVSMRARETLHLADASAAILAIGTTEKIAEAILSSARDYRRLHGVLPAGVTASSERQF